MIFVWCFYFINELIQPSSAIDWKSKPFICEYSGVFNNSYPNVPAMAVENIPSSCDIIVYTVAHDELGSQITSNLDVLKKLTSLKPVFLAVTRSSYDVWVKFFNSDSYIEDAKVLTKFALDNKLSGYMFHHITPKTENQTINVNISINIIPYFEQVKCGNNLIIILNVVPNCKFINNPEIYNFEALNKIVDTYVINISGLNVCNPKAYNGIEPLHTRKPGENYLISIEDVTKFLSESMISHSNMYYGLQYVPIDTETNVYTYSSICMGCYDANTMCIQNTGDLYDKAAYINALGNGVYVMFIEMDDYNGSCCCGEFIGLKNIVAGFHGSAKIPCAKFDVQKSAIID